VSRFTGHVNEPPEFTPVKDDTVGVRAFLAVSLYVPSAQINKGRMILVSDSEVVDDRTETFIGVDGETGEDVHVTVSYPK